MKTTHSLIRPLLAASLLAPLAIVQAAPEETKPGKTEKAAAASEAILKKLSGVPGVADAKVINIHIGDNITFGFDEGVDAEEWGMTENNNNAPDASGANPKSTPKNPQPEKPQGFRKIDFRKGDLVLVATEDPVKEPAPTLAANPEPAVTTTTPAPTPEAAPAEPAPTTAP